MIKILIVLLIVILSGCKTNDNSSELKTIQDQKIPVILNTNRFEDFEPYWSSTNYAKINNTSFLSKGYKISITVKN